MKRYLTTLIALLVIQITHSQTKTKLIEYLKSDEPTFSMYVNVFIPSFQKMTTDTPQIALKRKNDVWIYVGYRPQTKTNSSADTCYISTVTESHRQHYQSAGMTASQIAQANEGPCYDYANGYCNFIISTSEIHYVRFRSGQNTKTYKLVVTD